MIFLNHLRRKKNDFEDFDIFENQSMFKKPTNNELFDLNIQLTINTKHISTVQLNNTHTSTHNKGFLDLDFDINPTSTEDIHPPNVQAPITKKEINNLFDIGNEFDLVFQPVKNKIL